MPITMPPRLSLLALSLPVLLAGPAAHAEKADRSQPLVVESDGKQSAQVDLARKLTIVSGNVNISQGTLLIKADRVEVRETDTGVYVAVARGWPQQQASFRQKRDRVNETLEAQAERIEYDGGAEQVRFIGDAWMRLRRDGVVTDEAHAAVITYDQRADTVLFEGGGPAPTGSAEGKARLVFTPRHAASAPGGAAK